MIPFTPISCVLGAGFIGVGIVHLVSGDVLGVAFVASGVSLIVVFPRMFRRVQ